MAARDDVVDPLALSDVTDLPQGTVLTADDFLSFVRARFLEGLPYTAISPRLLVAVNPQQYVIANSDSALADWGVEYADCGTEGVRGRLGPHTWGMSGRAYYYMRRTGQDQAIVLSGETGSGKTEQARLLLKSLVDLSAPAAGKRGSKLITQIPAAFFILDTFGHATASQNSNASRFGRYTELQFSDKGRLVGVKGLEYFLETSRVTNTVLGERNFHVFYYLAAGASAEERAHLQLEDSTGFRYLSYRRSSASSDAQDAVRFSQLKDAFKAVGFPKKAVASIFQILSAILHLGNVEFHIDRSRNSDSAVVKNTAVLEIAADFLGVQSDDLEYALTNKSTMVGGEMCAVFLDADGASANRDDLARTLYGLLFSWIGEFMNEKLCREDFATFISIVDFPGPAQAASSHRDGAGIDAFSFNLAAERLHAFTLSQLYESNKAEYSAEGIDRSLSGFGAAYNSNSECVRLLTHAPGGLVHIIDDQSRRRGKTDASMLKAMAKRWGNHANFQSREGDAALGRPGTFTCSHWDGPVTYSVENFLSDNSAAVSPNFVSLLGGSAPKVGTDGRTTPGARDQLSTGGSALSFVRQLFSSEAVQTTMHPKSEDTIVGANQKVAPRRMPSVRRPREKAVNPFTDKAADEDEDGPAPSDGRSVVQEVNESITLLLNTLASTKTWNIFCLRPNDAQLPNQVDSKLLKHQTRSLGISELAQRLRGEWTANLELKEWWDRYSSVQPLADESAVLAPLTYRDKALKVKELLGFSEREMAVGKNKIFLSDGAFRYLEDFIRADDPEEQQRARDRENRDTVTTNDAYSPHGMPETPLQGYNADFARTGSTAALPLVGKHANYDQPNTPGFDDPDMDFDRKTFYTDNDYYGGAGASRSNFDEERSIAPSGYTSSRPMFDNKDSREKDPRGPGADHEEVVEEVKNSKARRRWVALTWLFTWWIPSFMLRKIGGMKRPDVRMAWREKLLINMLIWLLCGAAVFVIVVLGNLICPTEYVYSADELSSASYSNAPDKMLVAIRGEVFDLTSFAPLHQPGISVIPLRSIQRYGGSDITNLFPVQVSALCNGVDGSISPWVTLEAANTTAAESIAKYHDFRAYATDSRADWYAETMIYLRFNFRKGFQGYTPSFIRKEADGGKNLVIYEGGVYDMSTYIRNGGGGIRMPDGAATPSGINRSFMQSDVVALFTSRPGNDITMELNSLNIDPAILERQKVCLRNLFFVGKVDNRNSAKCQFSQWILIALSIFMVVIIGFKFLAALQFGRKRKPEEYDKFVICQVPCYTEGEESLRNCIDSLTKLKYDDKRKLLFIVCDGMIVGSGNDRPTPTIVLDILGADPTVDPEPLSFQSIGDGTKQHNMAKVYSGLHEASGHIVPYIVVVKVGKPTERSRPGNRGKRDSQMLMMRFLNRVHFDAPMAPAELEIYHQIKNVIGVNPTFYEYMLMIDADTVVDPLSLNYLVGSFVQDKKGELVGLCGETSLSNAKASWTTMMQVYEYFISHHMAKAFESLFGSVTCLPGCFSMYRIRSLEHKPLIIADSIIAEYGENKVETLHVKNLLSLGEDRYLTTLMLKRFPEYKMKFCREAHAQTIAPDEWKVLMSQRRRWINSTIHNLMELVFVDKLCGFCCFSMRFIVFIDLLSTLIAPVTVAYIVYLVYLVAGEGKPVPTFALIMLGAIYGCQVVIYVLHRRFEHIGWMLLYILAIPFFSFILPLVSFWQMDDFSWGSTREIIGEKGKRMVVHDEGSFDPSSIPLKKWQDFENELWEQGSNASIGEIVAAGKLEHQRGESRYGYDENSLGGGGQGQAPPYSGSQLGDSPRRSMYDLQSQQGSMYDAGGRGSQVGFTSYGAAGQGRSSTPHSISPARGMSPAPRLIGGLPDDSQIVYDVQMILASADLSTLTKKGVREELEERYGCGLGPAAKALVNQTISEQLGL